MSETRGFCKNQLLVEKKTNSMLVLAVSRSLKPSSMTFMDLCW